MEQFNNLTISYIIISMSDSTQIPVDPKSSQDDQKTGTSVVPSGAASAKEYEPSAEEDKMMAEIKTTSEAIDKEALEKVQEAIGDVKQAQPKPVIPPDVEDAGVVHPESEAEKVVTEGTTLVLPVDEKTYEKGLHEKVAGAVVDGVVKGVSSLAVLAMWITRIIKLAHKHAMRVVFKKSSFAKAPEDKGGRL